MRDPSHLQDLRSPQHDTVSPRPLTRMVITKGNHAGPMARATTWIQVGKSRERTDTGQCYPVSPPREMFPSSTCPGIRTPGRKP